MDEKKLNVLKKYGHYYSVPKGISMRPMLKSRENIVDVVPFEGKLKKYDVALYYRPSDNKCVLHRILKVRENDYIFYGDNCWQTEIVPEDKVIGVAASFKKNGKWIPVQDKKYMAYVHIWCDFLPARRIAFRIRDKIKRTVRNVKNK